jgi:Ca-activated chloride channel family protein
MGDGTALGMGLAIASYHLKKSTARRKAAVLISDGENNAGAIHPHTAAAMLAGAGASLWVIGVGSGGEVPIDYTDPYTKIRLTGLYDSRYDTDSLKKIAMSGGGTWIQAASADALEAAFSALDEKEMTIRRAGTDVKSRPFFMPFLICALSFIIFSNFIRKFIMGAWV